MRMSREVESVRAEGGVFRSDWAHTGGGDKRPAMVPAPGTLVLGLTAFAVIFAKEAIDRARRPS
jgi:hypothetical protein